MSFKSIWNYSFCLFSTFFFLLTLWWPSPTPWLVMTERSCCRTLGRSYKTSSQSKCTLNIDWANLEVQHNRNTNSLSSNSILLKTSRVYCWRHWDHTGSSQSQHSHKRELHMVVPASLLFNNGFVLQILTIIPRLKAVLGLDTL